MHLITLEVRLEVHDAECERDAKAAAELSIIQAPLRVYKETKISIRGTDVVCCTKEVGKCN